MVINKGAEGGGINTWNTPDALEAMFPPKISIRMRAGGFPFHTSVCAPSVLTALRSAVV